MNEPTMKIWGSINDGPVRLLGQRKISSPGEATVEGAGLLRGIAECWESGDALTLEACDPVAPAPILNSEGKQIRDARAAPSPRPRRRQGEPREDTPK